MRRAVKWFELGGPKPARARSRKGIAAAQCVLWAFLVHRRGIPSACRFAKTMADVALRILEADDRDHAARRRRHPRPAPREFCVTSTSPAPTRSIAPASRPKGPPTSSRSRSKPRSVCGQKWMCSVPTTRHRTAPASETIFKCPIAGFALSDVQHVAVNQENLASFCQCTTIGSRTQLSRESTENARIAY